MEKITKEYNFEPDDLTPVVYVAETMTIGQLNAFINNNPNASLDEIVQNTKVSAEKVEIFLKNFLLVNDD